jgi:hypothetical protein
MEVTIIEKNPLKKINNMRINDKANKGPNNLIPLLNFTIIKSTILLKIFLLLKWILAPE